MINVTLQHVAFTDMRKNQNLRRTRTLYHPQDRLHQSLSARSSTLVMLMGTWPHGQSFFSLPERVRRYTPLVGSHQQLHSFAPCIHNQYHEPNCKVNTLRCNLLIIIISQQLLCVAHSMCCGSQALNQLISWNVYQQVVVMHVYKHTYPL